MIPALQRRRGDRKKERVKRVLCKSVSRNKRVNANIKLINAIYVTLSWMQQFAVLFPSKCMHQALNTP